VEAARLESQRFWQAKCRNLRRQREEAEQAPHRGVLPDFMDNKDIKTVAQQISQAIEVALACYPGPQIRKEVLGRVLQ
jgi:hypothetical protein